MQSGSTIYDVSRLAGVSTATVSRVFSEPERVKEATRKKVYEAADALRGTVLYAKRSDLGIKKGALLVAEMIGLPVFDKESGKQLGTLSDVIHPGATDIYVIATERGEAMVPVVPAFVDGVDIEKGIVLTPIEGMFP